MSLATRSVSLPFPSSPHWVPTTTVAGTRDSSVWLGTAPQCTRASAQLEPLPAGVDGDGGTLWVAALEQGKRQGVLDRALQHPAQRAGPESRVVAGLGQPLAGRIGDLQAKAPLGQPCGQAPQLDVHDPPQVLLGEGTEAHDLVDAVDELGLEEVTGVARQVG